MSKRQTLRKSKKKHKRRLAGRKKQLRKFKNTGKKGHRKQAAKHGRAARKLKAIIDRLQAFFRSRPKSGTGAWGGSESILVNEVIPLVAKYRGAGKEGSGKRTETYGNPGSDHHTSQTTASARDFYLVNDYAMAGLIFAKLTGRPASEWGGDYSAFYITRAGRSYRVQAIAGTHGTGPHLHIGIRRT